MIIHDAVALSLIANVPSAMVTCWTFYKNGNIRMKKWVSMAVVALTGAVSHVVMGAAVDLVPGIVVTIMCTIGAVGSARFANKVSEKKLNCTAGTVLILVSMVSWILSA